MSVKIDRGLPAASGWRLILPDAQTMMVTRPGPAAARTARRRLSALPAGTTVVLLDDLPGSRRRTRRLAARSAITVQHEYAVLPRLSTPVVVVEDRPAAVRWASNCLLAVPPGTVRFAPVVDACLRVLRRWAPPGVLGAVAPGRVLVGRRQ